eukprot:263290_1
MALFKRAHPQKIPTYFHQQFMSFTSALSHDDIDLLNCIKLMIEDSKFDVNKAESLMQRIRCLDPIYSNNNKLNLASTHFMTIYHSRLLCESAKYDTYQSIQTKLLKQQTDDMNLGLLLLQNVINNSDGDNKAIISCAILKTHIAQRLHDSILLNEAYNELIQYETEFDNASILAAFTIVPYLGYWGKMKYFGEILEKTPETFDELFYLSKQTPLQIPAFSSIYELCKRYQFRLYDKQLPKSEITYLMKWEMFNILKMRIKFIDIDCGEFEEKRNEALNIIYTNEDDSKREVCFEDINVENMYYKKMGAICQSVSFDNIPMTLSGPWFKDKINILGQNKEYLNVDGYSDEIITFKTEQEWDLNRHHDIDKLYIGKYFCRQWFELPTHKTLTSEYAPANMTFECQLYIGDQVTQYYV